MTSNKTNSVEAQTLIRKPISTDFQSFVEVLINALKDCTGRFTTVLDGMKALLEHNLNQNLITDKFPKIQQYFLIN
jgi:hypothetical protein